MHATAGGDLYPAAQGAAKFTSAWPVQIQQRALHAALCTALVLSGPAHASEVDAAIAEAADAADPILRATRREAFAPFASRALDLLLSAKPAELSRAVDLGLDVALSVPPERVSASSDALAAAMDGLSPAACDVFPSALFEQLASSNAIASADEQKLKAVNELAAQALRKVPRRGDAYCLPPRAALPALARAQQQALAGADADAVHAFEAQLAAVGKSLPVGRSLKELPQLQAQAGQLVELGERRRLKAALAALDAARAREEAARKAALAPKVCYTMSCKDYALDLGADRRQWEDSIATGAAARMR